VILIIFFLPPHLTFMPTITQSIDVAQRVSLIIDDMAHVRTSMSGAKKMVRRLGKDLLVALRVRGTGQDICDLSQNSADFTRLVQGSSKGG
jgi:phosphoribosylpyrophosphate synthetase